MVLVSVLQFVCAVFLMLKTIKALSGDRMSSDCFLGKVSSLTLPCLYCCFQLML